MPEVPNQTYLLTYASGLAAAIPIVRHLDTITQLKTDLYTNINGLRGYLPDALITHINTNIASLNRKFEDASHLATGAPLINQVRGPIQLQAILSKVSGGTGGYWHPAGKFSPLNPDSFFPGVKSNATIWKPCTDAFIIDCQAINSYSLELWIPAFENLLLQYTTLLPWVFSAQRDQPLLESIKLTAAIMASLPEQKDGKSLLMIGCDLSGIQNYLFDIQSKNAAKLLKGRSFYLHLLTDAILRRILKDNHLQSGHVIYATAGGFYIIAPNSDALKKSLTAFREELLISNYKTHGEKLYTALAWVETDDVSFKSGEAGIEFRKLSEALNAEKRKPYQGVAGQILNLTQSIPAYQEKEPEEEVEADAPEEIPDELQPNEEPEGKDTIDLETINYHQANLYLQQQMLGKYLLSADGYAVWYNSASPGNANYIEPAGLGIRYRPFSRRKVPSDADALVVFNAIDTHAQDIPVRTDWYGGNRYPKHRNNRSLTYDELAGDESDSLKRLGVLRMDVDNLGSVFISGLPEGQRSMVRYAFLSRSLDQYFKLYLNYLHSRSDRKYKDWTQILYAGGDDLFILWKWDLILQFAEEIRTDFKRYCGNNPVLSVSAGISLVTGKFPVIRAAQWAGEQEENAKGYQYKNIRKDAVGIFDYALNWGNEWKTVLEMQDLLRKYLKESNHRSIIHRIAQYHRIAEIGKDGNGNEKSLRWRWQMAYDFSKIGLDNRPDLDEILQRIRNTIAVNFWNNKSIQGTETGLTLLAIAARLLEFETRTTR